MDCHSCIHEEVCRLRSQTDSKDEKSIYNSEDRCTFYQDELIRPAPGVVFTSVVCPFCKKNISESIVLELKVRLAEVNAYDPIERGIDRPINHRLTIEARQISDNKDINVGAEEKQDGKHWLRLEDPYGPRRPDTGPAIPPDSPAYGFCW